MSGEELPTQLPKDFFLGAAMSGPQTEGAWQAYGKLPNLWDRWSNEDITGFYNLVGSYAGNDFTRRRDEDVKIFKDLGLDSVRTSIQWSRLMDKNGKLNQAGADYYHALFSAFKAAGIDVFVNLYHFDMPSYLFDRGGWENREVIEAYANYARAAFDEFGQEIKNWFTFNEPIVEPQQRFTNAVWYPFHHDFAEARRVQYGISLAHSLAVHEFRLAQAAGTVRKDAKIGLINCFTPPYTKENPSEADLEAVRVVDGVDNRWWLDLVTKGEFPQDILDDLDRAKIDLGQRPGDAEVIKQGPVDWLGFNYYHPARVQAPSKKTDEFGNPVFAEEYVWPDAVMNKSRGWEIYPKGIYDFAMTMKENYPDLEWYVSENGIGIQGENASKDATGTIQDDYRVEFVRDHLKWIAKAIQDGAKCRGYHYWAVIDNWSWSNAFKNRYGFVEVNLDDNYSRHYKKSADWLRRVATTHTIFES